MERRVRLKKRVAFSAVIAAVFVMAFVAALAAIEPFYPEASGEKVYTGKSLTMDYSHCNQGYVMIKHSGSKGDMRVQILKGRTQQAVFYIFGDDTYYVYPLTLSSGEYTINVLERVPNGAAQLMSEKITVELTDEFSPFVVPNIYTNYTPETRAVLKADELFEGLTEDRDKVNAAWEYMKANMVYDYVKATTQKLPYHPDVDAVMDAGMGICSDYSALFGTMLRSHGIPTQLQHGNLKPAGNQYHAWSNVYFDGEWHLMDSTFALQEYPASGYVLKEVH